jgi:hypothetical protein
VFWPGFRKTVPSEYQGAPEENLRNRILTGAEKFERYVKPNVGLSHRDVHTPAGHKMLLVPTTMLGMLRPSLCCLLLEFNDLGQ